MTKDEYYDETIFGYYNRIYIQEYDEEGNINGIGLDVSDAPSSDVYVDLSVCGITFGDTAEKVIEAFGNPYIVTSYSDENGNVFYVSYSYTTYFDDGYGDIDFTFTDYGVSNIYFKKHLN